MMACAAARTTGQNTFWILLLIAMMTSSTRGDDVIVHELGMCVFSESCGYNEELENAEIRGEIPCVQNIPAFEPDTPRLQSLLEEVCPSLLSTDGSPTKICCRESQLLSLRKQLSASLLLFQRCPSCVENFRNLYCYITCSPDQAAFVNVTGANNNSVTGEPFPAVTDEAIYISQEFAEGLHTSCKDIVFPQTNGKAIELVCNGFSNEDCTSQRFLEYLGSTNNGVAPLNMDFQQIGNDTGPNSVTIPHPPYPFKAENALNPPVVPCHVAADNDSVACSCTDCEASCPAPPPLPPQPAPFTIGGADGVGVIMLIVFLAFAVLFIGALMLQCACAGKRKTTVNFSANLNHGGSKGGWAGWVGLHGDSDNRPPVKRSDIPAYQRRGKRCQEAIRDGFRWWGITVARWPVVVIVVAVAATVALSVGVQFVILTTDPIELWSADGSRVREEKAFFDDKFGAFFRTEQVIMTLKKEFQTNGTEYTSYTGAKHNFSAILAKEYLLELLQLQNSLRYMEVSYTDDEGLERNGTLNEICFIPLAPDNNNCTITSAIGYWQSDPRELNKTEEYVDRISGEKYLVDYRDHFLYCVQAPATLQETTPLEQNCMGDFGGPVFPFLVAGNEDQEAPYNEAQALIMTFVVNNYNKTDLRSKLVKAWEQEFLRIMSEWNSTHFEFTYFSERSVEDELTRSSKADLVVFVVSYLVIFIYIALALGSFTSLRRIPVDSKASLGVAGILVILASVFASIGFFGYVGYATSLIVIEVVPFLVLAIGADNVFILTLEFERDQRRENETLEEQVARVFGDVAPSMLMCSLTECVAFFLGALTDMPAVEQFAYASAVAILLDFLLQITAFLAVLALNARRQEQNRMDCFFCITSNAPPPKEDEKKSYMESFFREYYAPFLMSDLVRIVVVLGFVGLFCWCVVLSTNITIGLDQDLSVPLDSYVLDYFNYMELYLGVGVPVYFVTKGGFDFSNQQAGNLICASSGCDAYSMVQQISYASEKPDYWKIETPAASWYDDYVDWLQPQGTKSCCRYKKNDPDQFCPATEGVTLTCQQCLKDSNYTSEQFYGYLPWFLTDNPGLECNKGGHSAYGNAVHVNPTVDPGTDPARAVDASYFMAYHSVCIKSTDCTENMVQARRLAENITNTIKASVGSEAFANMEDFTVFPYCLYYVYYEQYLTMVDVTLFQLGICLIPTFLFVFILLGFDPYSGLITLFTIIMIVVDTTALSSLWGVDLNPVSLINLVAAIGLSVEFTSHVVRTFSLKTHPTRKERTIDTMATMGPAVFAGVALTNLPGIIVLNWATAQLIQIFFFRMCLITTLVGTAHGLIFLPVVLSYLGPPVNKAILFEKQQEAQRSSHVINRNYKSSPDLKALDKQQSDEVEPSVISVRL